MTGIFATTNLINWITLVPLPNPTGAVQFTNSGGTNATYKFYRASQP